jgi:large subunit ribosomal protein L22
LVVKEATVGEGPTMKRMMARARGSGSRILKRSSHIRIILTDEIEIKTREKRNAGKKKSRKSGPKNKGDAKRTMKAEKATEKTEDAAEAKSEIKE